MYIDNDLTRKEREVQREIRKIALEEKGKGNKTKIGYRRVRINDEMYVWNDKDYGLYQDETKKMPKN